MSFDLPVLQAHDGGRAGVLPSGPLLEEREQNILFPHDMPGQAFQKRLELFFRRRKVFVLQGLKIGEESVEFVVISREMLSDGVHRYGHETSLVLSGFLEIG
jgi:hypothetical protein